MIVSNDTPVTSGNKKIAFSGSRATEWIGDPTTAYCDNNTVYYATRSGTYTRNNCINSGVGSQLTYTKVYFSPVSQDAANALAAGDTTFDQEGQNYANQNGTCSINGRIYQNTFETIFS
jgi:hypothetical protein